MVPSRVSKDCELRYSAGWRGLDGGTFFLFSKRGFPTDLNRSPVTTSEMKSIEERSEEAGISKMLMMENAGSSVARWVNEQFGKSTPKAEIIIVAGTGNNGGDAFVAARHLLYWKFRVSVILIGSERKIRSIEARENWKIIRGIPLVRKIIIASPGSLRKLEQELKNAKVVISAIFGTGFKGRPKKLQELAIAMINNSQAPKVSVDLPSGMEADTGESRYAVISDFTISMHAPKTGMLRASARKKCGEIHVENIGVPF